MTRGERAMVLRALSSARRLSYQLTKHEQENRDDDGTRHPTLAAQASMARRIERTLDRLVQDLDGGDGFRPGDRFATPYEAGCVIVTAPDQDGNFEGRDSDGVLCSFHVSMIVDEQAGRTGLARGAQ